MSSAIAAAFGEPRKNSLWLYSPAWDLTFISLSAALVALPFTMFIIPQLLGVDPDVCRNIVNGAIAFLIGGPHMYSTYTRTMLDPEFRAKKRPIVLSSIIIPIVVVYLGVNYFILLLTFFFFWASVHVLHQIAYLVDCYNERAPKKISMWSRIIDYAVVMIALYPVAVSKLVKDQFIIGSNVILFPPFLKHEWFVYFVSVLFAVSVVAYVIKTVGEFRRGEGHVPKTILISITAIIAFMIPMYHNLDVSFQGFNTWHSFQYLGLTWYINRLRVQRGERMNKVVYGISQAGGWWKYYGFVIGCTTLTVGVILLSWWVFGGFQSKYLDQCYYIPILSVLLMHYYHDHILFTHPEAVGIPRNVEAERIGATSDSPVLAAI